MSPQEIAIRGEDAKRILQHAVFKEAWTSYEQRLVNEIANADRTEEQVRHLRALLIGARKARAHLERIVSEGAHVAKELELVAAPQKRSWWKQS